MIDNNRIQQLQSLWNGMLLPLDYNFAEINDVQFPTDAAEFISTIGLPPTQVLFQYWKSLMLALQPQSMSLIKDHHIWKIVPHFNVDKCETLSVNNEIYLLIGKRGDAHIGLHTRTSEIALIAEQSPFYLNANLESYVYALGLYLRCRYNQLYDAVTVILQSDYKYGVSVENIQFSWAKPDEKIINRYDQLIIELSIDDPSIVTKQNSWWLMHIEMGKRGL